MLVLDNVPHQLVARREMEHFIIPELKAKQTY